MSGFTALNIESDNESDIEIDDTKEIQIEEALKLYQTALHLHSQGPSSFDQAAIAYEDLFNSEIFQYPESQAELRRIELYGHLLDDDDILYDGNDLVKVTTTARLETGHSTLPQILHLSHKNYAQFRLDYLGARLSSLDVTLRQIVSDASAALGHFVQALDKDDSDLDLWRRTANVGEILHSKRLARYCLEAILDGDEEGLDGLSFMPSLEDSLAVDGLRTLARDLDDRLSILQTPQLGAGQKTLSRILRDSVDDYRDIASAEKAVARAARSSSDLVPQSERLYLKGPDTWAAVGETLLKHLLVEQTSPGSGPPVSAIGFDMGNQNADSPIVPEADMDVSISDQSPSASPCSASFPSIISDCFPGLDGGKPTVQPQIQPADSDMWTVIDPFSRESSVKSRPSRSVTMPSRKRSGDAAGLQEGNDEGRTKSKRLRARDSIADPTDTRQALIDANVQWELEQQFNELQAADDWMFETVQNLFERIGVVGFDAAKNVRRDLGTASQEASDDAGQDGLSLARSDLWSFYSEYNDQLGKLLLQGGEDLGAAESPAVAGSSGFPSDSKSSNAEPVLPAMDNEGLTEFARMINTGWYTTEDVAFLWTRSLLGHQVGGAAGNTYVSALWPADLKTMLVRTLVNFDESIYTKSSLLIEQAIVAEEAIDSNDRSDSKTASLAGDVEMIQTIFELHLDIYMLIKQANSGVDDETISAQKDRLSRWFDLARDGMRLRGKLAMALDLTDSLSLRFLWAATFNVSVADDVSQDHVIECMHDLRSVLSAAPGTLLSLPNNAVMSEISLRTLDREISRLTTKDFFVKVTSQDLSDPVGIIEGLEPLLLELEGRDENGEDADEMDVSQSADVSPELVRFLQESDMSVRLLLWQRLRDAYLAVEYSPMVVKCYLHMIRMVLSEMNSPAKEKLARPDRQVVALKQLRLLQGMVSKMWTTVHSSDNALECIDERDLKSAVSALGELLHLLQVFNCVEDSIRVGQPGAPTAGPGHSVTSFAAVNSVLHDMQVHIWLLLHALFKEAIYQHSDLYPTPAEDRFDFLRCVHRNLGLRGICGASNRAFVRMVKDEFLHMTHIEGYDSEQAQVLYDLYGLNCFLNPAYELIEHHCTHDAFLDRGVALQAVDLLLAQASKLPIKDLIKHSLKDTIDKVHGSVPRKKPSDAILQNREVYRAFLKSPINPLDLFQCLKGYGNELSVSTIPKSDAILAAKGWYFLMGHISLTKFKSQKRTAPAPTEDLDIAIAFFMQDLEYSMENWETWFRLAQSYDTKIEESVVWSAEKLNNSMPDIVQLQRAAIHCYTLATALALRSAEPSPETSEKMTELFYDFANRMYSSSREPFDMLAFALDDDDKRFISTIIGMRKKQRFKPLEPYLAWQFARALYLRALPGMPRSWYLQYMLVKCLWKMYTCEDDITMVKRSIDMHIILDTCVRAIELCTVNKRDSREKREPILEPHYKLVSLVHKLYRRGDLALFETREWLLHSTYAKIAPFPAEQGDWVPHVLAILKNLRAADKAHWHHRMIVRAAQIIYDDLDGSNETGQGSEISALGAKHELTQQMFTKTMVLQVWRPECERPGRHFVYTHRYTRFFVKILKELNDRPNIEQLARRVRRRYNDFFQHHIIWNLISYAYLYLLREYADLDDGIETSTFSNIAHEVFLARKDLLEKWMQAQDPGVSPALDVLREIQEFKKLNQSLMKPGSIDDLIGDAYAELFNTVGKQLAEDEARAEQQQQQESSLANTDAPQPTAITSPTRNPMMSLTHLMNLDGTNDSTRPSEAPSKAQSPAPPETATVPTTRKKIGVGRREIRTCAEACGQKAPAAKIGSAPAGRVQVVIETSSRRLSSSTVGGAGAGGSGGAGGGGGVVDTSAPGSVDDDADDESELSELEMEEEEEERSDHDGGQGSGDENEGQHNEDGEGSVKPLFPGLANGENGSVAESRGDEEHEEEGGGYETADEEREAIDHQEVEGENGGKAEVGGANGVDGAEGRNGEDVEMGDAPE